MAERELSRIATCDQWVRGSHTGTAVLAAPALTLTWTDAADEPWRPGRACSPRGLAVDRLCRVYQLHRDHLKRYRVGPVADGLDHALLPPPDTVIAPPALPSPQARFAPRPEPELLDARGIAIDADDRLFLADSGRGEIVVLDLWSRRLLRRVPVRTSLTPARRPVALTAHGRDVVAVLVDPPGFIRLRATGPVVPQALPHHVELPQGATPAAAALLPDGGMVTLWHHPDGGASLLPPENHAAGPLAVPGACTLIAAPPGGSSRGDGGAYGDGTLLVLAPATADDERTETSLRRVALTTAGWVVEQPLHALGYDGNGLVALDGGRIGYIGRGGLRLATAGRVRYGGRGHWISYRLDSGRPGNRWGRMFLDACVPTGTGLRFTAVTSDDESSTALPEIPAVPAACTAGPAGTPAPSPPLPPTTLPAADLVAEHHLHRRRDDPSPWWRAPADSTQEVFEAPVPGPAGRYLWVVLELTGDTRRTPTVRAVRVERSAHTLTRRLPRVLTGSGDQAEFLHRYLGLFDGLLHDLLTRAERRDLLVDPASTPTEALEWLASFVALTLDDRWAEAARRRLIAEVVTLYRRRGTIGALDRYLSLFLAGDRADDPTHVGARPVIVEHLRLRGLGPDLGREPVGGTGSVLGGGVRVGTPASADPQAEAADSAAHRFTVIVPRPLTPEQDAAVRRVLDVERPAHTEYTLCTVEAGMRAGNGLHLDLTSVVGPTGALRAAVLGRGAMDDDTLLGGRSTGLALDGSRLSTTARVG